MSASCSAQSRSAMRWRRSTRCASLPIRSSSPFHLGASSHFATSSLPGYPGEVPKVQGRSRRARPHYGRDLSSCAISMSSPRAVHPVAQSAWLDLLYCAPLDHATCARFFIHYPPSHLSAAPRCIASLCAQVYYYYATLSSYAHLYIWHWFSTFLYRLV